ncbi:MAG TPA: carbamoyltransferase HypF [Anaerolineaceae bacterium]|nr:carbamoyltransferase HypF [Anaerolineaceae bacterium]
MADSINRGEKKELTPVSNTNRKIHVSGIVQGVGFRPFIYKLATSLGLNGWVKNTSSGVDIVISGEDERIQQFLMELRERPPALSRIDAIITSVEDTMEYQDFQIIESQPIPGDFLPVSPDISICPDCQRELFNPTDRRFRYPFINCTNCGPRFSIITEIPYDRPNTTMSVFPMCPECEKEYRDPLNRRYHAQPTACQDCGPQLIYLQVGHETFHGESALQSARQALREGLIVAIKGLGGYHLACDALNQRAVSTLHERKQRSDKPFALMAFDLETIQRYALVNPFEQELLTSIQHPIVLLQKRPDVKVLDHTAPSQLTLGFMIPYTPLHLLLLEPEEGFPSVLVMTSANLSEEPIAYQDEDALDRLNTLADAFLLHDRAIHTRVDDSVMRAVNHRAYPIRRSRGYAPDPIRMDSSLPQILACGAELKNTFALSRDRYVFLSHHIGDLENIETLRSFEEGISHYKKLFRLQPEKIAVDLHPDYLSTRFGHQYSRDQRIPLIQVQHHHAHLASCLADNGIKEEDPVIGLIFDGTGYGPDGSIWGGEILVGGYTGYQRRFHLQETPLPGGDSAIRNPAKIALAQLFSAGLAWEDDLPPVLHYSPAERKILFHQLSASLNCVPTSSMGRLFDAVASLVGIRQHVTYEGQAAIELENLQDPSEIAAYSIRNSGNEILILDLYPQILKDLRSGIDVAKISARFHNAIAQVCLDSCLAIRSESGIRRVALSGGVWQNISLLQKTLHLLKNAEFDVLIHHRVPTNDGGIALGQIMVASRVMQN